MRRGLSDTIIKQHVLPKYNFPEDKNRIPPTLLFVRFEILVEVSPHSEYELGNNLTAVYKQGCWEVIGFRESLPGEIHKIKFWRERPGETHMGSLCPLSHYALCCLGTLPAEGPQPDVASHTWMRTMYRNTSFNNITIKLTCVVKNRKQRHLPVWSEHASKMCQ